jgi:superfamily II DNA helicase RecQ
MIVFVNDTTMVQRLVDRVEGAWAFYYGALDGVSLVAAFKASVDGILFCTSAAEHGLDVADVAYVIYAIWLDSLTSYLQGAGRGGCDGLLVTVVLLVGKGIRGFKLTTLRAMADWQVLVEYA